MGLQAIFVLAVIAAAIAAGLDKFSFWWVLIPAFFAASLNVSNRYFDQVRRANEAGNLWLMPTLIGIQWAGYILTAGIVFGITRWIA